MKKLKNTVCLLVGIIIISSFVYKVVRRIVTDHVLKQNVQQTKAVIIDERNYMGNQPVKPEFSYSYQFVIKGQKFIGNAHDNTLNIGDSVEVIFNKNNPIFNKPLNPKD